MKLSRPARTLGAAPRRILGGYGPLLALAIAFVLVVTLVPTIAREETVVSGGDTGLAPGQSSDLGGQAVGTPGEPVVPGVTTPGTPQQPGKATTQSAGTGKPASGAADACADRKQQVSGDPYSPPCMTWPAGKDNGGATYRGVTKDKIRIGFRIPVEDIKDFQSTIGDLAGEKANQIPQATEEDFRRTMENLVKYFEKNFQFYGRKIELVEWQGKGSVFNEIVGAGQEAANADAIRAAKELNIFADISAFTQPYADALSRQKVLSIGALYMSREWFAQRAPYAWSPFPDCTSLSETIAEYMNKRVFGYPADHAGEGIKGKERKVGLITPDNPEYQQCANTGQKQIEANGHKVTRYNYTLDLATLSDQANNIAAKMKADGITTIVLASDPLLPLLLISRFSQQNYYPEYVVTGVGLMDSSVLGQLYDSSQWKHAFGLSMIGEEQPQQASYAYAAAKSVDPNHEPIFGVDIFYYFLYQLATGLQMAGPNLTPQTFSDGLRAYPGGTGPAGTWSYPKNTWAPYRDAREIWWDPEAVSVYNGAKGAYRSDNKRYKPGKWPKGPAAPAQLQAFAREPAAIRENA
ncbi:MULTISPECIES: ABC transporter substrate-binding protein [Sporichthya]|uniref:ABC transporter substrate-binding protein n=1 Tax=Sporichthya brevicatena TaxID=171442 RepID=A0ABP3RNC6_9ACTN|nr:ABC transporter substrate-binding protein [Sporichthya polymorpha]